MNFHCTDPTECNIYIGLTEYYPTSGKKWGSGVAQPTQSLRGNIAEVYKSYYNLSQKGHEICPFVAMPTSWWH